MPNHNHNTPYTETDTGPTPTPESALLLAGQALRNWTRAEIKRVTRYLRYATLCCLAGITLASAAVLVVGATPQADPAPPT